VFASLRRMAVTENNERGSERDALTGLASKTHALAGLGAWQAEARASGAVTPVHVMLVGLRRFDTVNLAYGEAAGDNALVELAARIQRFAGAEFEPGWIAARAGGGSFLLAVQEPCSRERWQWLAEALAGELARPMVSGADRGKMRLWPRIALMRALARERPEEMLGRLAETLDRLQQEAGRRITWVDSEIAVPGRNASELETDLIATLERDEIEVLFQPQFSTVDDSLVGAEALARWQHPLLGRIGAPALFAIAERADLVPQVSRRIAQRALAEASRWPEGLGLSLNVTAADIAHGGFAGEMAELVQDSRFDPARLTLEITEQVLVSDLESSAAGLGGLVGLGIRLALDDFGAGFCNFRYLKLLPLHTLKLDRTMVDDILEDERDLAVFRAIVAMARALGLTVIAEGIESEAQRELVAREGCALFQGFLRAEPMTAEEFALFAKG